MDFCKPRFMTASNGNIGENRLASGLLLLLLILFSSFVVANESSRYTYRLGDSKDDPVCRRMTAVYNKHFSRPFDGHTISGVDGETNIPVHSRYPTSREFDAIKWEFKIYPLTRPDGRKETWSGLISEFDIDNDGLRDVVFKSLFFRGAADENEQLIVFSSREFDPRAVKDAREFFEGQREGSKPRIIHRGAILRPFVLNRKTYLSAYDYKRYTAMPGMGETRNSAHTPPQFMRIYQYEGGGHVWPGFESEIRLTELCVIRMSRAK